MLQSMVHCSVDPTSTCPDTSLPTPAGVRLSDGRQLPADLVVDASGRTSTTPVWLAAAGFEKPPEVSVSANLGYGTCCYEIPQWGEVSRFV